eukprot:7038394-Pyramimonas_sp.AAC.1
MVGPRTSGGSSIARSIHSGRYQTTGGAETCTPALGSPPRRRGTRPPRERGESPPRPPGARR